MNKKLAHFISYILHPGFMPGALYAIILFMGKGLAPVPTDYKWLLLALVVNFTLVLPLLIVLLLHLRGALSSLKIPEREERLLPFVFITISYSIITFLFYHKLDSLPILGQLMGLMALTQAISTLITMQFKISIHSIAIAGVLGALMAFQINMPELEFAGLIVGVMLLAGLTMSARLSLNAHTPEQVYAGAAVGFGINFFGLLLVI